MKNVEKIRIEAYKHNGELNLVSEDSYILDSNSEFLVCGNYQTLITEGNGNSYTTNEYALLFFFKNDWYNIICQFKKYGIFYYCNIASPFVYEKNVIKYIDYDLDLRVFPDGTFKVLDKNEYVYHKKIYNYSKELDGIVKKDLTKLINIKKSNQFPFQKEDVLFYLEKLKKIIKE